MRRFRLKIFCAPADHAVPGSAPRKINMTLHTAAQALGAFGVCTALAVCTLYVAQSSAQSTKVDHPQVRSDVAPIYGVRIPAGYRDWALVNVAHEAGNLNDFRVVLG